jgi:hypothetical protein
MSWYDGLIMCAIERKFIGCRCRGNKSWIQDFIEQSPDDFKEQAERAMTNMS